MSYVDTRFLVAERPSKIPGVRLFSVVSSGAAPKLLVNETELRALKQAIDDALRDLEK